MVEAAPPAAVKSGDAGGCGDDDPFDANLVFACAVVCTESSAGEDWVAACDACCWLLVVDVCPLLLEPLDLACSLRGGESAYTSNQQYTFRHTPRQHSVL